MVSNRQRLSLTMTALIVIAVIVLIGVGLASTGQTWAAPDQPAGQGATVPTRTPAPTRTIYLPIVARF